MIRSIAELSREKVEPTAVVVGPAPSVGSVLNHADSTGYWLGDAHKRVEVVTTDSYYVRANSIFPSLLSREDIDSISAFGFKFIFAETVMESARPVRELAEERLTGDVFLFDQRHFEGKPCSPVEACCSVLANENWSATIQEFFARHYKLPHHYSSGDTVALHALACALITGAKEVYIGGVEIPFWAEDYIYAKSTEIEGHKSSYGINPDDFLRRLQRFFQTPNRFRVYLNHAKNLLLEKNKPSISYFAESFHRIFSDFQYLTDAARGRGQRIFYCSRTSNLRHVNGIEPCPICLPS